MVAGPGVKACVGVQWPFVPAGEALDTIPHQAAWERAGRGIIGGDE